MNKHYCVYMHRFPNGKKYIGISCDAEKRWRNGKGYETQGKIAHAIDHYGWENVEHHIIVDGVSKDQAQSLEKLLIAELDTIESGYNTAIGGDNVNGTYLDSHVLAMIRYAKKHFGRGREDLIAFCDLAFSDRYKKQESQFWNEADSAVTRKHGKYSSTDEMDVCAYWFHIAEYVKLYMMVQRGEDTSTWKEGVTPIDRRLA